MSLEETLLFISKSVCKKQLVTGVCNHYPTLALHIAGIRIYKRNSLTLKSWNMFWREWTKVVILQLRDTIEIVLQGKVIFFRFSFQNAQLVNCNRRHSLSKTMSSVTYSRAKVKFSSRLVSASLSTLQDNVNFQQRPSLKSNEALVLGHHWNHQ